MERFFQAPMIVDFYRMAPRLQELKYERSSDSTVPGPDILSSVLVLGRPILRARFFRTILLTHGFF